MPITKIEKVNPHSAIGLWRIDETEEELFQLMALDSILQMPTSDISNTIKKQEWMAGRLVLKALVEFMGLKYEGIYKDEVGKPHLNIHPSHISLTHSYPWVGAVICEQKSVGIDLEQPKGKLRRIAYKFLNNIELEQADNNIEKLCVYWCAKEALYKLKGRKGIIFKENLMVEPFELDDKFELIGNIVVGLATETYILKVEKVNKTYLVYTLN